MLVLDPAFWFLAPLVVALLALGLALILPNREAAATMAVLSLLAALLGLAAMAFWSWLLRDGLGPGVVPSTGAQAWLRFAGGWWVSFLLFGAMAGVSMLALRRRMGGAR